jgi:hypothetical protein
VNAFARPRGFPVNEAAFDEWDPASCYWAGLLFADGTLGSGRSVELTLTWSDRGHVRALRSFLRSRHTIRQKGPRGFAGSRPSAHLAVGSVRLARRLAGVGMVEKALRLAAPALEESPDFWRGVLDGDAWIGFGKNRGRPYPCVCLYGHLPLLGQYRRFLAERLEIEVPVFRHMTINKAVAFGPKATAIARALYERDGAALPRKRRAAARIVRAAAKKEAA